MRPLISMSELNDPCGCGYNYKRVCCEDTLMSDVLSVFCEIARTRICKTSKKQGCNNFFSCNVYIMPASICKFKGLYSKTKFKHNTPICRGGINFMMNMACKPITTDTMLIYLELCLNVIWPPTRPIVETQVHYTGQICITDYCSIRTYDD